MKLKNGAVLPDGSNRALITTDIVNNYFVEAAAGSGKTKSLVDRMVALVAGGIKVSKICAITFTKAAANEFYKRFQDKLTELTLTTEDKALAALYADALANIDLCFMGTIDSFCSMVLSEHPSEAGIPANAQIVTEERRRELFKHEYIKVLAGEYGDDVAKKAQRFDSYFTSPADTFSSVLFDVCENRSADMLCVLPTAVQDMQGRYCNAVKDFAFLFSVIEQNQGLIYPGDESIFEYCNKHRDVFEAPAASLPTGTYIHDNFLRLIYAMRALNKLRLRVDPAGLRPALPPHILSFIQPNAAAKKQQSGKPLGQNDKPFYTVYLNLKGSPLRELLNEQFNVAMAMALNVSERISAAFRARGEMYYSDNLMTLRNLLREDAGKEKRLIKHIQSRHSHFLIDEFQDTDPLQAEIFFYLAAGENADTRWEKCTPKKGSLFIVGDPKQSIYSFKSADVASFNFVKDLFETKGAGSLAPLTFNFRSTPKLCKWFNAMFTDIMKPDLFSGTRQAQFTPIPIPDDDIIPAVAPTGKKLLDGAFKLKIDTDAATEEDTVVSLIMQLVNDDSVYIQPEPEKPPRRVRYGDFMIITPKKADTLDFKQVLERYGIATHVEAVCPFESCPALTEIIKILAAVADPYDSMAVFAALTGSILNISEDRAALIGRDPALQQPAPAAPAGRKKGKDTGTVKHIDLNYLHTDRDDELKATCPEILSAYDTLRELNKKAFGLNPSGLFTLAADTLKVYSAVGDKDMKYLYYALELLREAEKDGEVTSFKEGIAFLRRLMTDNREHERCLNLQRGLHSVHLANLHKVKGLESPIVILARPSKAITGSGKTVVRHLPDGSTDMALINKIQAEDPRNKVRIVKRTGSKGVCIFYKFGKGQTTITNTQYEPAKQVDEENSVGEVKRHLYVAATRAMNALIICSTTGVSTRTNPVVHITNYWKRLAFLTGGKPAVADIDPAELKPVTPSSPKHSAKTGNELYAEGEKDSLLKNAEVKQATVELLKPSGLKSAQTKFTPDGLGTDSVDANTTRPVKSGQKSKYAHIDPRLRGTAIHKLMEELMLSRGALAGEMPALTQQIADEICLESDPALTDEVAAMLAEVGQAVLGNGYPQEAGVSPTLVKDLISNGADEIHCELPLCLKTEEAITYGIIDLVYRQGESWHIIDYKTKAEEELGLNQHYAGQLNAYAQIFAKLKGIDPANIDAKVYQINF